jgi:hypothetical protein
VIRGPYQGRTRLPRVRSKVGNPTRLCLAACGEIAHDLLSGDPLRGASASDVLLAADAGALAADGQRVRAIPAPINTIKTPQAAPSSVLPFLGRERASTS